MSGEWGLSPFLFLVDADEEHIVLLIAIKAKMTYDGDRKWKWKQNVVTVFCDDRDQYT